MQYDNVYAVITGRFQPFHIGHLDLIKETARQISNKIIVGVVTQQILGKRSQPTKFEQEADKKNTPIQNPFTYWERYQMIRQSLGHEISKAEVHILPFPRPEVMWEVVQSFLPPRRVWVVPRTDLFDDLKADFFAKMGEKVVRLNPNVKIHGTDIRKKILQGEEWFKFIPKATLIFLKENDGISRLRESSLHHQES